MQTSTTAPPKKPEIQEWENEGGATRPPVPEEDSLAERVENTVRTLPQRVSRAVQQQPLLVLAAALGIGLLIGSRLHGSTKAPWTRFGR